MYPQTSMNQNRRVLNSKKNACQEKLLFVRKATILKTEYFIQYAYDRLLYQVRYSAILS